MSIKKRLVLLIAAFTCLTAPAQEPEFKSGRWETLSDYEVPEWYKDAKFGIYFHWGVYSVPAYKTEWYPRLLYFKGSDVQKFHEQKYGPVSEFGYHDLVPLFTAEKFNARKWVSLFRKAGAKFVGPVAEHHDGFSMWDSNCTPWNAADMGPKKDILGEISKEARRQDLKLIATFHHARNLQRYSDPEVLKKELSREVTSETRRFYDSHYPYYEGTDPASNDPKLKYLYGNIPAERWYKEVWLGKLEEVIDKYCPDIIWFDSWLDLIPENYRFEFCRYYLNKAKEMGKEVVIVRKQNDLPLSVSVENLEKSRKNYLNTSIWETDETISWGSWCYTEDLKIKPASNLIYELIDIVSKNGVMLLNISPKANGEIPENQRQVLLQIGKWLDQNGEAIYGTRPWYTFGEGPTIQPEGTFSNHKLFDKIQYSSEDFRYTTKGNSIYIFSLSKLEPGKTIKLKSFSSSMLPEKINIKNISMLGTRKHVDWKIDESGLSLSVPAAPNEISTVYKVELK